MFRIQGQSWNALSLRGDLQAGFLPEMQWIFAGALMVVLWILFWFNGEFYAQLLLDPNAYNHFGFILLLILSILYE